MGGRPYTVDSNEIKRSWSGELSPGKHDRGGGKGEEGDPV